MSASAATEVLPAALVAFAVTLATLVALLRSRWATRVLDRPNQRSLHTTAVPRLGGLAIAAGVAAAAALAWDRLPGALQAALGLAAALAAMSWVDDVRGLPAAPRLAGHLAAAAGLAWALGVPPGWLPVAALAIAWSANLYNFMDGADGLAGGMAATGFGAMAAGLALAGDGTVAALAAALAAAALAFLMRNAPPAAVFLGDSGSIPLGFLAAAIGAWGWRSGAWGPAFPLLAFLPFWLDASATLAMRTLRGEKPWQAHREHFYQKAVRSGLGHRGVALRGWALMAACACGALATTGRPPAVQALILAVALAACALLAVAIERRHRRTERR
jgi:UDP-N-acetylmuramyl pentapeptide phosphotransferase/UDP-N-acetylglucosamine-1-phosphate transferase